MPGITVIVSEHRAHHGKLPVFRAPSTLRHQAVRDTEPKKPFVPLPVGTICGPFACGTGAGPDTGIQYCVQTPSGWFYYIRPKELAHEALQLAKDKSAEVLAHELSDHP